MRILVPFAIVVFLSSAPAQVPGSFASFGQACSDPSVSPPTLTAPVPPEVGKVMELRVTNLIQNRTGLIIAGWSNTTWQGLTLPLDLSHLGAPNCTLYSSGDCLVRCGTGNGLVVIRAGVPNDPRLVGQVFFAQFYAPDPNANASGFAMSNAGKLVIGG